MEPESFEWNLYLNTYANYKIKRRLKNQWKSYLKVIQTEITEIVKIT